MLSRSWQAALIVVGVLALLGIAYSAGPQEPPAARTPEPLPTGAPAPAALRVSGLVHQPVEVTSASWRSYPTASVRLNDVRRDGAFHGVFACNGVPLRALLEQATVEKRDAAFKREMDLAVVVRSRTGEATVLSWGELFFRNPQEVVVAFEGSPVMPHKPCEGCHDLVTYGPRLEQLRRAVSYPKLVATRDFYSERSVEGVTEVEVVDLGTAAGLPVATMQKPGVLRAEQITVHGAAAEPIVVRDLEGLPRLGVDAIMVGQGIGYHGIRHYEGVSLRALLEKVGVRPNPRGAVLLSAPDGYRVLLSNAELFTVLSGVEILLADRRDGKPFDDGGRFQLILPEDLAADRWLKSVARVDLLEVATGTK